MTLDTENTTDESETYSYHDNVELPKMGVPMYGPLIIGLGLILGAGEDMMGIGGILALGGYAAMCVDGFTPLKACEFVGELTCLPYDLGKIAYKKHQKVKRAKNIKALREQGLEELAA